MKKYKSKIEWGIVALISIFLGAEAVVFTFNRLWNGLIVLFFVALFITYVFSSIRYWVSETELIVKSAFAKKVIVPIDSIRKIKESNNPWGSPAASLDRLEIFFEKKCVIISPQQKAEFINHLLAINPKIQVVYKNK